MVQIARDHGAAVHIAGVQSGRHRRATRLTTWDGRSFPSTSCWSRSAPARDRRTGQRDGQGARLHEPLPHGPARARRAPHPPRRLRRARRRLVAAAALRARADDRRPRRRARPAQGASSRSSRPSRRRSSCSAPPPRTRFASCSTNAASSFTRRATRPRLEDGELVARARAADLDADRVVSLPRLRGPLLAGPARGRGRLHPGRPARARARRAATSTPPATPPPRPIKQGGVATQQADAAAEAIAARAGAPRRAAALPPGAARAAPDRLHAALHARRGERRPRRRDWRVSGPRAVVAAEQDRRPLARPLPGPAPRRARGEPAGLAVEAKPVGARPDSRARTSAATTEPARVALARSGCRPAVLAVAASGRDLRAHGGARPGRGLDRQPCRRPARRARACRRARSPRWSAPVSKPAAVVADGHAERGRPPPRARPCTCSADACFTALVSDSWTRR